MPTRKSVGHARLAKLADYLENTKFKKGKFHMGTWMGGYARMSQNTAEGDPMRPQLDALAEKEYASPGGAGCTFRLLVDPKTNLTTELMMPIECKTAGCAVGWGIAGIPAFRKAGLNFYGTHAGAAKESSQQSAVGIIYAPKGTKNATWDDLDAVEEFFALYGTDDESLSATIAERLFLQTFYKLKDRANPKTVAKRIRAYLAKGEPALANLTRART